MTSTIWQQDSFRDAGACCCTTDIPFLVIIVADPESGAFLIPGSGMNIPDHIFMVKMLKFFDADADADPGSGNLFDRESGMEKI